MSDEEDESRPGSLSQSFKDQNPLSDLISADKEGWLEKRGEKNTAWKKRWFVLKNNRLLYYKKVRNFAARALLCAQAASANAHQLVVSPSSRA